MDNRNPQNLALRKLLLAGSVMAEKLNAQGTIESQAIAAAWGSLLATARAQNLLGAKQ